MADPLDPPVTELDRLTTAPVFYGSNIAWLLLGFILVETYKYHIHYHRDSWLLRLCAYGTVFLTIAQTAVETYCGTYYFVQHWGQASAIKTPPKPLVFQTLFDGIVGFMVQVFFLWRIWVFVRHNFLGRALCVFTMLVSLLAVACSLAIPIIFVQVDNLALLKQKTGNLNTVWLAATSATDLFIAVSMLIILRDARSRSAYSKTRDILSRFTRVTIQTGSLTFCVALLVLLIRVNVKVGTLHTLGTYVLGKSYVLSLFINLNARVKSESSDPKRRLSRLTFSHPSKVHQPTSDPGSTTTGTLQLATTSSDQQLDTGASPVGAYKLDDFSSRGKTGSETQWSSDVLAV